MAGSIARARTAQSARARFGGPGAGALFQPLARRPGGVLHAELADRLRDLIAAGGLASGARLPGARALAAELGVSRVTVTTAVDDLVAEGYLEASERRGTIVAAGLPNAGFRRPGEAPASASFPAPNPWSRSEAVTIEAVRPDVDLDLGPESFSLAGLDVPGWGRRLASAWRELASEPDGGAVSYFGALGDPVLRTAIARQLGVARGVRAAPESIAVTAGATAALAAVARVWLGPGRTCVVENPGGEQLRRAMASAGGSLVAVPVDTDGLIVDALPDHADVALVTPSWQYPNGGRMPLGRRLALLDWARRTGCVIVEDDCEGELRHDGPPLPALQGLAEDGRVVYVNTFSKVVFPGLRTGYLVVPNVHRTLLLAAVEAGGRPPGAVEQRALGRFLESGAYVRHVRRVRAMLASRRAAFRDELARGSGGVLRVRAGEVGGHLIVELPAGTSGRDVAARLLGRGVRLESLASNVSGGAASDRALAVYLARTDEAGLREAARRLATVVGVGRLGARTAP
jgi:GntR family transcriptional regulator/MocR family aminotransferase